MNTPKLLTPAELEAIRARWSATSDKGSWGKEDVAALLGHVEALRLDAMKQGMTAAATLLQTSYLPRDPGDNRDENDELFQMFCDKFEELILTARDNLKIE